MGNRAVITTKDKSLALYLHWNGGRDTVEPLLKYCELQGYRPPSTDSYGWARMAQVVGNFFGGSLSVGIDTFSRLGDQGDNGVYVIDGWKIVERIEETYDNNWNPIGWSEFPLEREQREYDFNTMLKEFDKAMPKELQLGEFLDAVEIPVEDIELGDKVWIRDYEGSPKLYEVVGFGDGLSHGWDVTGKPYVNRYDHDGDYSWNCNNYVDGETAYIKKREEAPDTKVITVDDAESLFALL